MWLQNLELIPALRRGKFGVGEQQFFHFLVPRSEGDVTIRSCLTPSYRDSWRGGRK